MIAITRTVIAARMIGGAALGLAGVITNATSTGGQAPTGPGYSFSPET